MTCLPKFSQRKIGSPDHVCGGKPMEQDHDRT